MKNKIITWSQSILPLIIYYLQRKSTTTADNYITLTNKQHYQRWQLYKSVLRARY